MKIYMTVEDVYLEIEYTTEENFAGEEYPVVERVLVEGVDIYNLVNVRTLDMIEEKIPIELAEQKWSHDEDNRD